MAGTSETEIKDIRLEKAGDKIKPSGKNTNYEPSATWINITWRHFVDGVKWQYVVKTAMVFWFLDAFLKLGKATISLSYLSVCLSEWNNSVPRGRIFMKVDIREFFETLLRKFNFH
jgi:hypothetical protein